MEKNRYILQWEDYCKKALEAMENNHFDVYDDLMKKADDIYKLYREDSNLTYECTNFGMANYIFENALPSLFKFNKNIIKEFIETIKNDNNLLVQFKFYNALKNINEGIDKRLYINEALQILKKSINVKTLNESNNKLFTIIKENKIRPTSVINESDLKYFNSCDYLFKHNPKLSNLNFINENLNTVIEYCDYKNINNSTSDFASMMESFEEKYKNILTEEEKSFVKEIIDTKSENATDKKETLFNKIKSECIETLNTLLESSDNDEKDGLKTIKGQINNMMFCENTLVKDIAKLLEIRDILNN
jgi:hypothetical protein